MWVFGLFYVLRRCIFFLNYLDGKFIENDIVGLVCNGNFLVLIDIVWKVCFCNIWLLRYCILILRIKF